jgi:hypothetical protein
MRRQSDERSDEMATTKSVAINSAVMTGRRRASFEKWAPAHNLTVDEAIQSFPQQTGITRFGTPEEIADGMTYLVSAGVTIDDRRCRADGRRRDQGHLGTAGEEEWSVGDF